MRFAFITPESGLSAALISRTQSVFTPFYVISPTYRDYVVKAKERGDFLILEGGYPQYLPEGVDMDRATISAASKIAPDIVVLPQTTEKIRLASFTQRMDSVMYSRDLCTAYMYTLKGIDSQEVRKELEVLEWLYPQTRYVGLHRDLERLGHRNFGGRSRFLSRYANESTPFEFWLRGFYKNPMKELMDIVYNAPFPIYGADTSKIWRIVTAGRRYEKASPYPADFDYYQSITSEMLEYAASEFVRFLREFGFKIEEGALENVQLVSG